MKKILSIIPVALALLAVQSCDTKVEKLEIQHFNTYDLEKDAQDPYYENLREWKQSKHTRKARPASSSNTRRCARA